LGTECCRLSSFLRPSIIPICSHGNNSVSIQQLKIGLTSQQLYLYQMFVLRVHSCDSCFQVIQTRPFSAWFSVCFAYFTRENSIQCPLLKWSNTDLCNSANDHHLPGAWNSLIDKHKTSFHRSSHPSRNDYNRRWLWEGWWVPLDMGI
jgi:hypothetical protein